MSRKNKRKKNGSPQEEQSETKKQSQSINENLGSMSKWKEKYFTFHGRMNRKTYIEYTFLALLYGLFTAMLLYLGGTSAPNSANSFNYLSLGIVLIIPTVWLLLSTNIRRWHDLGRHGYFVWINIACLAVPALYIILLAYLFYKKGTDGANQFGPDMTK